MYIYISRLIRSAWIHIHICYTHELLPPYIYIYIYIYVYTCECECEREGCLQHCMKKGKGKGKDREKRNS